MSHVEQKETLVDALGFSGNVFSCRGHVKCERGRNGLSFFCGNNATCGLVNKSTRNVCKSSKSVKCRSANMYSCSPVQSFMWPMDYSIDSYACSNVFGCLNDVHFLGEPLIRHSTPFKSYGGNATVTVYHIEIPVWHFNAMAIYWKSMRKLTYKLSFWLSKQSRKLWALRVH